MLVVVFAMLHTNNPSRASAKQSMFSPMGCDIRVRKLGIDALAAHHRQFAPGDAHAVCTRSPSCPAFPSSTLRPRALEDLVTIYGKSRVVRFQVASGPKEV